MSARGADKQRTEFSGSSASLGTHVVKSLPTDTTINNHDRPKEKARRHKYFINNAYDIDARFLCYTHARPVASGGQLYTNWWDNLDHLIIN